MYLSRVKLDIKRYETKAALMSPQIIHSAVENCFNSSSSSVLWRLDLVRNDYFLVVVSNMQPDFKRMQEKYGDIDDPMGEISDYGKFLTNLKKNRLWRFRLRANPVRSSFKEKDINGRGKVFSHVTREQQKEWLLSRAESKGFILYDNSFDVVENKWLSFFKDKKGTQKVDIATATFEGILGIGDIELFKDALTKGIGRGKAYGCGLITLARYEGDTYE